MCLFLILIYVFKFGVESINICDWCIILISHQWSFIPKIFAGPGMLCYVQWAKLEGCFSFPSLEGSAFNSRIPAGAPWTALAEVHSAAPRDGHFSSHPSSCQGWSVSALGARPGNHFRQMDPTLRNRSYFSVVFVSHFSSQHSHRDVWAGRKEQSSNTFPGAARRAEPTLVLAACLLLG